LESEKSVDIIKRKNEEPGDDFRLKAMKKAIGKKKRLFSN